MKEWLKAIPAILLACLVGWSIPVALTGCGESTSSAQEQSGGWQKIGYVSDGHRATTIWKITDKETGDTVYATSAGGIFVVGKK